MQVEPSWRRPAGIFLMLLLIGAWAALVATGADLLRGLHWTVHLVYYAVAGIAWIAPMKPLLTWMETGRFRHP